MPRETQVNCTSEECYYNVDKICRRSGIHATKRSCCCYTRINGKISVEDE